MENQEQVFFNVPLSRLEPIFKRWMKEVQIELHPQKEPVQSKMLSVKEIAKFAGVSELSIRNYILEGKIQAKRIGGRILIDQIQFVDGLEEVKSLKYKR